MVYTFIRHYRTLVISLLLVNKLYFIIIFHNKDQNFQFQNIQTIDNSDVSPIAFCGLIALRRKKILFPAEYRGLCNDLRSNFLRQGHPTTVFCKNICSEKQKLPRIFYYLSTAKNFQMAILIMYNFRSFSNKSATIF